MAELDRRSRDQGQVHRKPVISSVSVWLCGACTNWIAATDDVRERL
jgi:hypothetical protein